jgi:hypothetical protein
MTAAPLLGYPCECKRIEMIEVKKESNLARYTMHSLVILLGDTLATGARLID